MCQVFFNLHINAKQKINSKWPNAELWGTSAQTFQDGVCPF